MTRSSPLNGRARIVAFACSLVVALALLPGAAAASDRVGDGVVVGGNETVSDDLSVASGDVVVRGTVEGDLSALAGSVRVTGEVTEDVSATAGAVTINGTVGEDVSAAGERVAVGPDGRVDEGVDAGADRVVVEGAVGDDVRTGGDVRLGSDAAVGGDVVYGDDLDRAAGSTVDGEVRHRSSGWEIGWTDHPFDGSPVPGPLASGWSAVYWTLVALVGGGVLLLVAPEFSEELVARATEEPLRSAAAGVGTLGGVPVLLIVFLLTIVGIPVALAGGVLFAVAIWLGLLWGEYLAGRTALRAVDVSNRWASLALGIVGVEALSRLPRIGGFLKFVVLLLGLGAGAFVVFERRRDGDGDQGDADGEGRPDVDSDTAPGLA